MRLLPWVAACSITGCLLTSDFDGLGGGASDAAAQDGASPDGSTSDALPGADGGSDAPSSVSRGCADIDADFCADFAPAALTDGWTRQELTGGEAARDGTDFISPPAAFASGSPSLGGADSAKARLIKDLVGTLSEVHLRMRVRVATADEGDHETEIASILFSGDPNYTLYLMLRSGGDELLEYSPPGLDGGSNTIRHALKRTLPRGAWTQVTIDASLSSGTASVGLDGNVALSTGLSPAKRMSAVSLRVGVATSGPSSPWQVHFDDVAFVGR